MTEADGDVTLRVVRGEPTAEELAAVTALMSARTGGCPTPASAQKLRGRWNDPAFSHRRYLPVGPGAWRASAR